MTSTEKIEITTTERNDWHNLCRMMAVLRSFKWRVAIALGCLVLAKLANVGVPLLLKQIIDVLDNAQQAIIVLPVLLLIGYGLLRIASSLFNELRDALFAKVRYGAMRQLSTQVMAHLHRLSLRFHLERKTGAIFRDLERGNRSISNIINFMVFQILPTIAEFSLVMLILFVSYDIQFVIITSVTVMIYAMFTFRVTEWRMHFRVDMNKLDSIANTQAVDSLINYETVKYFGNEDLELDRYKQTFLQWEDNAINSFTTMTMLNFGQGVIIAVGVTWIMFCAVEGVVSGIMTIGDLVLINAFLLQLFVPLNTLGIVYRQVKNSLVDMSHVVKLLDTEPEIKNLPDAKPLQVNQGTIRFENVSFAYNAETTVLNDFSLTVAAGQKVAVVGASGAGKSTLSRLLYRFYDIHQGQILIDGQNISSVTQESLRDAIGIVPQDTVLFNESLRYNLVYARHDASQHDIERAAKMAHIHDFISSLPHGYDTIVGERGLKLSGGEKQRVAIARAILKKPLILIFDEATSSLDTKTEQAIQTTLSEVAEYHTTLVIAHRLSTIVDAHLIVVMDKGRIVETGSHSVLLKQNGLYQHMWQLQQQKYP